MEYQGGLVTKVNFLARAPHILERIDPVPSESAWGRAALAALPDYVLLRDR